MKVAVLYGDVSPDAPPDEQDVLEEVASVSLTLEELGYEPIIIPLSEDLKKGMEVLKEVKPTFAFNLVTSLMGKGKKVHLIPSLLASLKIPCTGASTMSLLFTNNKLLAKEIMKKQGIPTPDWFSPTDMIRETHPTDKFLAKAVWEHGSSGLLAEGNLSREEQIKKMNERFGDEWFFERFIEGREITFALIGNGGKAQILPPMEILFTNYLPEKPRVLCFHSKWVKDSFEYKYTRRSFAFNEKDKKPLRTMEEISRQIWEIFNLSGYARIDFRLDEENNPYVLEINANCCLSPDSGFIAQAKAGGFDYSTVVQRIIGEIAR